MKRIRKNARGIDALVEDGETVRLRAEIAVFVNGRGATTFESVAARFYEASRAEVLGALTRCVSDGALKLYPGGVYVPGRAPKESALLPGVVASRVRKWLADKPQGATSNDVAAGIGHGLKQTQDCLRTMQQNGSVRGAGYVVEYGVRLKLYALADGAENFVEARRQQRPTLNELSRAVLSCLRTHGAATITDLIARLDRKHSTIRGVLWSMCLMGLVERVGSEKNGATIWAAKPGVYETARGFVSEST